MNANAAACCGNSRSSQRNCEVSNVAIGFGFYPPFSLLLTVVVVAALAIWLLRRQSAPRAG